MFDCKISLHLVDLGFNGEVRTAFEAFNFKLNALSGSALGRLEGCTIDQKFASTLVTDVLIAFPLFRIVIGVAGVHQAARQHRFASGRARTARGTISAKDFG